jgi:hypothetical protein
MLIRKLEFGLENCEVITIDGKYIGDFYAGDIKKEIARMACNHIGMEEICHSFYVEVHKEANKTYSPFGIEKDRTLAFDRLIKWNDITDITIHLYDQYNKETRDDESKDTVYHYLIHWVGDDDYENPAQKSKIAKTGWFYLVVDKTKTLEDVFPDEMVDDEEYADLHASMMDIGDKYFAEHQDLLKRNKKEELATEEEGGFNNDEKEI